MRFSQPSNHLAVSPQTSSLAKAADSKPYNAFILASVYAVSWRGQKQRVGLVRRCKLSILAVHNGSVLQPNPAQILAAIAVQLNAAASPAIFATDFLTNQQSIS